MPSRHKQLCEFNGACEEDKKDCEHVMSTIVTQGEGCSGEKENSAMLEGVWRAGFRPQIGWDHRQNYDDYRQAPCHKPGPRQDLGLGFIANSLEVPIACSEHVFN